MVNKDPGIRLPDTEVEVIVTVRQQMQSIGRGEKTHRLPFALRLDLLYADRRWSSDLLAPYGEASLEAIYPCEGWVLNSLSVPLETVEIRDELA